MTEQTPFSHETLRSVSGASIGILLVVQLIKDFPIVNQISKSNRKFCTTVLFLI